MISTGICAGIPIRVVTVNAYYMDTETTRKGYIMSRRIDIREHKHE